MINQNKKLRFFLSFTLLFIACLQGKAQLILSEPLTGSHEYVDPEQIRLAPGFNYGATTSENFIGRIGEYSTHIIKLGTIVGSPLSTDGIVGAIPGAAGVSPTGSATYSIPIEVPAGIKGMQPNLSINYNSHAGNSMLGLGMSLGGLSAIIRVPDNPYYDDGNYHAIDFTQDDKLSLDGQRLLVTSSVYGSTNSTYTTENDPSTKITLLGSGLSASASYFRIETKRGITMYYGNTDDSKLILSHYTNPLVQTHPLVWYINRMEDANGNYMIYNYTTIDGEKLISSIEYTGNGSQAPFYKIQFNYIERIDANFSFVNGAKLEQKHLLDNIEILYNNMLKKYNFAYEYDITARMVGISLQNADWEYINPTIFNWEEKIGTPTTQTTINCENGIAGDFNADGLNDFIAVVEENGRIYERLYLNDNGSLTYNGWSQEITFEHQPLEDVLDFNGDGKMDVLDIDRVSQPRPDAPLSNFHVERPVIGLSTGNAINYLYGPVIHYYDPHASIPQLTFNLKCAVGDFNGDGLDDVFLLYEDNSAYLLSYKNSQIETIALDLGSNLVGFSYSGIKNFLIGDYNGDGLTDIGYITINRQFFASSLSISEKKLTNINLYVNRQFDTNSSIKSGDFNGDGLTDVAEINSGFYNIFFINGGTNATQGTPGSLYIPEEEHGLSICGGPSLWECSEDVVNFSHVVGDINQDGKADIIYTVGKMYTFIKNSVGGPITQEEIDYYSSLGLEGLEFYTDRMVWVAPKKLYVAFGRGDGTFVIRHYRTFGQNYGPNDDIKILDLNGDGILDIYVKNEDSYDITSVGLRFHNYQLKTATDGLNNTVQFDYKSLNNPSDPFFYIRYNEDEFPVRILKGSFMAVEKVTHSNGSSNDIVEKYSYEDGKVHALGKGFLGFSRINKENLTTGIYDVAQYVLDQDYFVNELRHTSKRYQSTATLIESQNLEGSFTPLGGKRYLYKLDKKIIIDNLNSNTVTKHYTYDDYLNVLTKRTVTDDATILTTNQYVTRGSWCDNKIETTTTTYTRGAENESRTKDFLWDSNGNLTKETTDPGDANELVTDFSDYDEFGNPQTISTTARNYPPRTGTFTYENGRMLKTTTNSLSQVTTFDNNLAWGKVNSVTDFKNRITSYSYDGWGRQDGVGYPDGIDKTSSIHWANGDGPSGAAYYSQKTTSGTEPKLVWFDAKGRKLRVETTGFGEQQVYVDTEYDEVGRVDNVSQPYYEGGTKNVTTIAYDDYGRVLTKTLHTGEVITNAYAENEITVTGPNTNITKRTNSLGEVTTTIDNKGNESVSYEYYPDGMLKSSTPSTGTAVTMKYDTQGNRTEMIDPDAGTITSEYNGFGELIWQQDNKGNRTTNNYDTHGRLDYIERNNASTIDYSYNTDNLLESISDGVHSIVYEYDGFDRITKTTENIDSRNFVFESVLDEFGRVKNEIYPSGYTITNVYDNAGILTEIIDEDNVSIWKADIINALGQFEQVTKGNEVSTIYEYDAYNRPTSITAGNIIDFTYEFDPIEANLNYRKDELTGAREDFTYDDKLDRLTGAILEGEPSNYLDIAYEANGNILSKTDAASNYVYDATQPHAVSTLEGFKNIPAENTQTINYNHFNKVSNINEGDYDMNFTYGVDNYRRKTELYNASVLSKTKYIFGQYEVEVDAATNERKIHYIAGGDGLAAIYIEEPGTAPGQGDLYYAYADHLGSLVALQDENGIVHRQSFDPWGRRRDVNDWGYDSPEKINIVDIGYTGHEHLNEFGIINMTGRLYDPVLGRMLSPDPHIQAPGFAQNFNRYSYAWNNPLVYTDPSGEFIEWIIAGAIILGKFIYEGHKANWDWSNASFTVGVGGSTSGINSYGVGVSWNGYTGINLGYSQGGGIGGGYMPLSPSTTSPITSYGPDNLSGMVNQQIAGSIANTKTEQLNLFERNEYKQTITSEDLRKLFRMHYSEILLPSLTEDLVKHWDNNGDGFVQWLADQTLWPDEEKYFHIYPSLMDSYAVVHSIVYTYDKNPKYIGIGVKTYGGKVQWNVPLVGEKFPYFTYSEPLQLNLPANNGYYYHIRIQWKVIPQSPDL